MFFMVETIMKTRGGEHSHTNSDKDEAKTNHEAAKVTNIFGTGKM